MIIYAIDDEENSLEYIVRKIKEASPESKIYSFLDPSAALKSAETQPFDVAFLDIQMPGIDGIKLARKFKKLNLKSNLIFVTGYSEYTMDAFSLDASGYLLKPATAAQVKHALENLRYPICLSDGPKMTAQCFGNFELFVDGKPLKFKYTKSKEVVAYMIDRRGAICRNEEVIVALWEDDDDHAAYYRSLIKDIHDTLEDAGCEDVFIKQWGGAGIDKDKLRCDYFDYLDGQIVGVNAFKGEYMNQYSWAEETAGALYDMM